MKSPKFSKQAIDHHIKSVKFYKENDAIIKEYRRLQQEHFTFTGIEDGYLYIVINEKTTTYDYKKRIEKNFPGVFIRRGNIERLYSEKVEMITDNPYCSNLDEKFKVTILEPMVVKQLVKKVESEIALYEIQKNIGKKNDDWD